MKPSTEFRLVVVWPSGSRPTITPKKTLAGAVKDATRYVGDPLGRVAHVETRTVTASKWEKVDA